MGSQARRAMSSDNEPLGASSGIGVSRVSGVVPRDVGGPRFEERPLGPGVAFPSKASVSEYSRAPHNRSVWVVAF